MNLQKNLFIISIAVLIASYAGVAAAGDFDWMQNFNIRADADPSGFRARLAARFGVADAKVEVVLGRVSAAADAYMVFRLGEMSQRTPDYVLQRYRSGKGKGWGALAKSLGIKPGSKEFHALKRGDDLYEDSRGGEDKGRGKGRGKGKG
jgi:hypothetical protein